LMERTLMLFDARGRPLEMTRGEQENVAALEDAVARGDMDAAAAALDPVVAANDRQLLLVETAFLKGMVDWLNDQAGWARLVGQGGRTVTDSERRKTVEAARHYAVRDPLCVQATRLYRDFAFGKPFKPTTSDARMRDDLLDFWTGLHNRCVFSFQGVRQSSDDLVKDGELFFAVFGRGPTARVRRIDPLQIERIITNPDDASEPWWCLRRWYPAGGGASENRVAYRMMHAPDDADESLIPNGYVTADDYLDRRGIDLEVCVYHVAVQTLGGRGHSLLMAAMPWAKAFRRFMESRLAVQQAIARYAWKRKVRGTAEDVKREIAAAQSGYVAGDAETNPPPAWGAIRVENQAMDTTPMPQQTGAGEAARDGTMIVATFGAAVGMFPHYFGFEALSRMATADAMELPMLRMFQAYQTLWSEVYLDLISYALVEAEEHVTGRELFDVVMPAIVERDTARTLQAIGGLSMALPEVLALPEVRQLVLTLLGIRNPAEVLRAARMSEAMSAAERERAERAAEQALAEALVGLTAFNRGMERLTSGGGGNGSEKDAGADVGD